MMPDYPVPPGSRDDLFSATPSEPPPAPSSSREEWQADGRFRKLDPGFIPTESIGSWVFTAFCAAALMMGTALALALEWFTLPLLGLIVGCGFMVVGLLVFLSIKLPRWQYEHIRYAVSDAGIEIHQGIIWRSIINVPRTRVQHTDVTQGPVARRFGIATLHIYTAGTEHNHVTLTGLSYEVALRVRNYLVGEVTPDDV